MNKATDLGVAIAELVDYALLMDIETFPMPNWAEGLVVLPKRTPSLSAQRGHNPRRLEAPCHCTATPLFHDLEKAMRAERHEIHEQNAEELEENPSNFITFGWESPLKLVMDYCRREVGVLIQPCASVGTYHWAL